MMKNWFIGLIAILIASTIYGQNIEIEAALLKHDAAFDYNIYNSLDAAPLNNEARKARYESLKLRQRAAFNQFTCKLLYEVIDSFPHFELAPLDELQDFLPYPEQVPAPLLPKRVLKRKGQKMGYRTYLVCYINVQNSLSSNGRIGFRPNLRCEIQLYDRKGDIIKSVRKSSRTAVILKSSGFGSVFSKTNDEHYQLLNDMLAPEIKKLIQEALFDFEQ